MRLFFNERCVGAGHAFATTRKAGWIAESLEHDPPENVTVCDSEDLTAENFCLVHDRKYVMAVQKGNPFGWALSQGFPTWDVGLWQAVCASNGGLMAAVKTALTHGGVSGALATGLHHARRERGEGFCTFNGLALAALLAKDHGAKRVLILDLDAHCGGGTWSMVRNIPGVVHVDISVSDFDRYDPVHPHSLVILRNSKNYLRVVQHELRRVLKYGQFDLCLYNAGMDPFEGCAEGGMPGMTHDILAEREVLVFNILAERSVPTAFVLAGGYLGPQLNQEGLVALHRLTIHAAANV